MPSLPRYVEIRAEIEGRIRSGEWRPGHRVPSEHELMEQYGCSRMTVHKALSALAHAGLLVRRRRSGTVVAMPANEETVLEIHDIEAEITATKRSYGYELQHRQVRPASPEEAERLRVEPGARILSLRALHSADGRPFVLENRLVNLAVVPEAEAQPFRAGPSGSWLLRRIPWTDAEHAIRAVPAGARAAEALAIRKGAPCLQVERRTWQSGVPVTFVQLLYPGERHQLVGRFGPGGGAKREGVRSQEEPPPRVDPALRRA
jgi:GntR family transcriptional regulator, histidine utilization repressor